MDARMRKARVLAVDDKRANLLTLEALLGSGYDLVFASSGQQAIALLEERDDIDLILMDVQMPVMDGFQTAAIIKQMPNLHDVPIIFVTAVYDDRPFVKRGYEVGGIDYFTKPFDADVLKMKVEIYASFRLKADLLRERERKLHESEELLKVGRALSSVLEGLEVGVLIADGEGRICQSTDAAARILSSFESAVGGRHGEILLKTVPLGRALRGESSHSDLVELRGRDGSSKKILVSAAPLRGLDHKVIIGAVLLIQDLTPALEIEEDMEQRVTRLIATGGEREKQPTH